MYTLNMAVAWDPEKARQNLRKDGVRFADAILDLEDPYAVTISDHESEPSEMRWVTLGADAQGRVRVVAYTYRGEDVRPISARLAEPHERKEYETQ
jgi:uncharacterized protein